MIKHVPTCERLEVSLNPKPEDTRHMGAVRRALNGQFTALCAQKQAQHRAAESLELKVSQGTSKTAQCITDSDVTVLFSAFMGSFGENTCSHDEACIGSYMHPDGLLRLLQKLSSGIEEGAILATVNPQGCPGTKGRESLRTPNQS